MEEVELQDQSADLEALKAKYKDSPEIYSRVLYRLGSMYYAEGNLDKARSTFQEFLDTCKNHPLTNNVEKAVRSIDADQEFLEKDKPGMTAQYRLLVHPSQQKDAAYGPKAETMPEMTVELGAGPLNVDLFAQDAPKSVEAFLSLAEKEKDYFKDLKFTKRADGKGWEIEERKTSPKKDEIDVEPSSLPVVKGTVALVRNEATGKNFAARFQIFTQDAPELEGKVTVIGQINNNMSPLDKISEESVKHVFVYRKRSPQINFGPTEEHHDHDH
jgi:cyclophilin family peptidyl-prolyl cis-trans isomerase